MFESKEKKTPLPWFFESHNNSKRSRWLQSTVSELDHKTIAMLKLIEEDADSFAQRAEMYYRKRPELINMVEDFYRAHRSLAERFDMVKSETRTRMMAPLSPPVSSKPQLNKLLSLEKSYDSYSETYSESGESEVDDPEVQDDDDDSAQSEITEPEQEEAVVNVNLVNESELMKLREEIERLKEENKIQKEQLLQKDEEKREVIRQLCSSMEILKENSSQYKNRISKEACTRSTTKESSRKWGPFEFSKAKGLFSVKLFNAASKTQT